VRPERLVNNAEGTGLGNCGEPVRLLRPNIDRKPDMGTILLIILIVLLFGGGGGYYAHRSYGGAGLGGVLGLVVIILIVLWLAGGLTAMGPPA
jgi:hypothetical protein